MMFLPGLFIGVEMSIYLALLLIFEFAPTSALGGGKNGMFYSCHILKSYIEAILYNLPVSKMHIQSFLKIYMSHNFPFKT